MDPATPPTNPIPKSGVSCPPIPRIDAYDSVSMVSDTSVKFQYITNALFYEFTLAVIFLNNIVRVLHKCFVAFHSIIAFIGFASALCLLI